mgnify:FL=1
MNVKEARQQFEEYLQISKQIDQKRQQLERQQDTVARLYQTMLKEDNDVEKLDTSSFTNLFNKVTGQMAKIREKEKEEAHIASLRYHESLKLEQILQDELTALQDRISVLKNAKMVYRDALADIQNKLSDKQRVLLGNLQDQLERDKSVIKESDEAIEMGNQALDQTYLVLKTLQAAKNWGMADILGADLIGGIGKYQKISEAKKQINDLNDLLYSFKRELSDVHFNQEFYLDIGSFDMMADFMIDNLFSDMMVQSKLDRAYRQIKDLELTIERGIRELNSYKQEQLQQIENQKERIRQFLEECSNSHCEMA